MQTKPTGDTNHDAVIDSIIIDCNDAVKALAGGNYIQWCAGMVKIVQKLANLKQCIRDGIQSREDT